jgi:DNA-binding NtrC family response regulator
MPTTKKTRMPQPLILIVDDEACPRQRLMQLLTDRLGYRVVEAETSEQALEFAQHHDVDLVISDLARPGMGGLEFLQAFKAVHPATPVIIYSCVAVGEREQKAYQLGAFRCLQKPATAEEIVRIVGEGLGMEGR